MTSPAVAARRPVAILLVVQFISMGAMEMSGPFWPLHLRTVDPSGAPPAVAGVAVYVGPMLGVLVTSTAWGRLGDRFGHRLMMLRALAGLAATQLALAWANDVWAILLLRFLQGACAGYIAPAQAYGVGVVSPERRARLFAMLQAATNVGSLAGAVAGGVILDHAPFAWINVTAAVLCAGCLAAVALMLPEASGRPPVAGGRRPAAGAAASPPAVPVAAILAIVGVLLAARMVTQATFAPYVVATFAVENWVVGLCYGLLALGFVAAAGRWADHFQGRPPAEVLERLWPVVAGCVAVAGVLGTTGSVALFAALHFVWGGLLAATTPVLLAVLSRGAGDHRQGRLLGLAQGTAQLSSVAGIAVGGWAAGSLGLDHVYAVVAALYAAGVALIIATRLAIRPAVVRPSLPGDQE
ncbi:MFS transporter [Azospirillum sp. ST 5-10]|uniref:MFS transporter n=1 Tax=unclassified Azospirillum TaxID=2630922 RepID=UPI003F49E19A